MTRLTCDSCGEVIGVYEPTVAVVAGQVRETSRAAEPAIGAELGELYHQVCYHERFGKTSGRDAGSQPDGP